MLQKNPRKVLIIVHIIALSTFTVSFALSKPCWIDPEAQQQEGYVLVDSGSNDVQRGDDQHHQQQRRLGHNHTTISSPKKPHGAAQGLYIRTHVINAQDGDEGRDGQLQRKPERCHKEIYQSRTFPSSHVLCLRHLYLAPGRRCSSWGTPGSILFIRAGLSDAEALQR